MGNKHEKESSKLNVEECKKEYFKAINRDLKESMKKINSTLQTENSNNNHNENEKWVDYLRKKFDEYCALNNNYNKDNLIKQIKNYQRIILVQKIVRVVQSSNIL